MLAFVSLTVPSLDHLSVILVVSLVLTMVLGVAPIGLDLIRASWPVPEHTIQESVRLLEDAEAARLWLEVTCWEVGEPIFLHPSPVIPDGLPRPVPLTWEVGFMPKSVRPATWEGHLLGEALPDAATWVAPQEGDVHSREEVLIAFLQEGGDLEESLWL